MVSPHNLKMYFLIMSEVEHFHCKPFAPFFCELCVHIARPFFYRVVNTIILYLDVLSVLG